MSNNNPDQIFDPEAIEQLQKDLESAIENWDGKLEVLPTRASVKRQFVNLDANTMQEVQKALEELEEHLGKTPTNRIGHLAQFEVDDLVEELLAVRKVNDILSSREDTLKTYAKDVISSYQIEPDKTSGDLVSPKHKLKISKEIRGGKLSIDIDLLKKRLTGEQFSSVTNVVTTTVETTTPDGKMDEVITTTYEVNDKFLEAEMVKGNILSEDVFLSSVESKRTSAMYIRDLEN
jgi:hypothetical protein